MAHLETELEQSRLRETETLGALREMQDKVLDMEKVWLGKETKVSSLRRWRNQAWPHVIPVPWRRWDDLWLGGL